MAHASTCKTAQQCAHAAHTKHAGTSRYVDTVVDARRRSRCGPAPHGELSIALQDQPACRKTAVQWL
eukprot:710536-Prymnesium_polylepis.2